MHRRIRVLFGPKHRQRVGIPAFEPAQAVYARMTAGAKSDEAAGVVVARLTVMNMEAFGRPACLAAASIPLENGEPVAPETVAAMDGLVVTRGALARNHRRSAAARAE